MELDSDEFLCVYKYVYTIVNTTHINIEQSQPPRRLSCVPPPITDPPEITTILISLSPID